MEKDDNIFKAAANKLRQPKQASIARSSVNVSKLAHDPEVDDLLNRLQKMSGNIQEAFSIIAKQMGMTSEELHVWLEDENHFQPEQLQLMKELAEKFKAGFYVSVPNPKKKTSQELEKDAKNRRAKTLGSRKNWIPLR